MLTQPRTDSDLSAISVSCRADKLIRDAGLAFTVHLAILLHCIGLLLITEF